MKGLQLFAVLLLVAVALVQVQAQDTFASICKDQYESCITDRNCCRNMKCRQSRFVNRKRCVGIMENGSGLCAKHGDLCSRNSHCCLSNKCVFGKCK